MPSPQSDSSTASEPPLPPVKLDPIAALFSYLVPGLGQVYQGRVGKGLLFFFGLYLLFFYGMWMGHWRNVWLPDATDLPEIVFHLPLIDKKIELEGTAKSVYYRPQFLGQFCIGAAAWPATLQYIQFDRQKDVGPMFGKFERTPTEDELNDLQRNGSKRWDLGWVYTVIAGVLNLLVIYDAFAGPMFRDPPISAESNREAAKPIATPAVPATSATPHDASPNPVNPNPQGGTA